MFFYLIVILLILGGCAVTNGEFGNKLFSEAIVTKEPDRAYLSISCHGKYNSMRSCITAANSECPEGWYVTIFINDDTGTLENIRQSQTNRKYLGGITSVSADYKGRKMTVFCKTPEEKPFEVNFGSIPDINIDLLSGSEKK